MFTFIVGILILFLGYIFYSKYVEKQFAPDDRKTPATAKFDGVDYMPLPTKKNLLIHLLNIAGLGPILGAIQGILFGPIAFLLIPAGCILMGGVHDYFAGMISSRHDGAQITDLIKKYFGEKEFFISIVLISLMLMLVTTVFVYTSGDIMAERFFGQNDFSLTNQTMITIYIAIAVYYILAALFPIDKIIGKLYPLFALTLIIGSLLVVAGLFAKGVQLQEINFAHLNLHPKGLHLIPMFFMTVSCGLLSGFHSTQATIISRTIKDEYEGRKVFYGMMCIESLIAMIWAAGAMYVYNTKLVAENLVGTPNVINAIADALVNPYLAFIVTLAVIILPITSGDTALRALRMTIADCFNIGQIKLRNRLRIIVPLALLMLGLLYWAKSDANSFGFIWRYFNFGNQLIAIPTFLYATIFLYKNKKNYLLTLLPGLFFVFITMSFIFNAKIGFNLPYEVSKYVGLFITALSLYYIIRKMRETKEI